MADGGADFKEGDSAVRDMEGRDRISLTKGAVALRRRVSVCTSEGSTFPRSRGKFVGTTRAEDQ
jgi:hypothetical protein